MSVSWASWARRRAAATALGVAFTWCLPLAALGGATMWASLRAGAPAEVARARGFRAMACAAVIAGMVCAVA
eukprot:15443200-Alexandrium_andersonii.AAC.1